MDLEERRRRYRSSWQAQFSYAWVQAVASTVGVTCQLQYQDIDGVDVLLLGGHRWPALSAQVKSWTVPVERDGRFSYRLDRNDYDRLREPDDVMGIPSILVLVVMPRSREEWLAVTEEGRVSATCGNDWFTGL